MRKNQASFALHRSGGVGFEQVEWFNGGLFDDDEALPLEKDDVAEVLAAARLDWAEIDPSIFGTLFERGLDPAKRSQLGAHYTDRDKINLIIEPVIVRPLMTEWESEKAAIQASLKKAEEARAPGTRTKARKEHEPDRVGAGVLAQLLEEALEAEPVDVGQEQHDAGPADRLDRGIEPEPVVLGVMEPGRAAAERASQPAVGHLQAEAGMGPLHPMPVHREAPLHREPRHRGVQLIF
jgi:hypothetical protein